MNTLNKIGSFIYYNSIIQHFHSTQTDVRLFIDSRDVIDMTQGLRTLMTLNRGFDLQLYKSDSTLTYSLIYGGWLQQVYLTIPHQEELLRHFEKIIFDKIANDDIKSFWDAVLEKIIGLKESDFKVGLSNEQYAKKITPKVEQLYKANYLLVDTIWQKRFKHLERTSLQFDPNDDDLVTLAKSDIFRLIYKAFIKVRPGQGNSKNNLTDTMVLCLIHSRLQNFKARKTAFIPVFCDTKNLFHKIIETSGTTEEFNYKINDQNFCVICDSQFLHYYALFRNREKIGLSIGEKSFEDFSLYDKLLRSLFTTNVSAASFLKEYSNLIDKFTRSTFFEVCWVNSTEKVHEFISRLINAREQLRSDASREFIEDENHELLQKIRGRSEEYSIFKDIFEKINLTHSLILKQFTSNLGKYHNRTYEVDLMNEFSLIRFSAPQEHYGRVNSIVKDLLFIDEEDPKIGLITDIIEYVISGLRKRSDTTILIPLLVFWVLGEYRLLRRMLDRSNGKYTHFSEGFLHAATIAKTSADPEDGIKIKNILEEINAQPGCRFSENYQTAIAASYILFHSWMHRFDKHFLTMLKEPASSGNPEVDDLLSQSIHWAKTAILLLEKQIFTNKMEDRYTRSKYYYIINNKIYYTTMGAQDPAFLDLEDDVAVLEAAESKPEHWQFRYHDTLAMYYCRKALIEQSKQNHAEFHFCMREAKTRIAQALDWVISIEDEHFYIKLQKQILRRMPG